MMIFFSTILIKVSTFKCQIPNEHILNEILHTKEREHNPGRDHDDIIQDDEDGVRRQREFIQFVEDNFMN